MKYLFIFLASFLIVACNNTDQKPATVSSNADSANAKILEDSTNYTSIQWIDSVHQDLPIIKEGQVVEVSWHFKNTGSKPLVIAEVTPGCGCTVADKPKEPIAPGQEGTIKAKFDSKGQHLGSNEKYLTVNANTQGGS